jgi:site-specific recombinase XerD
MGMQTSGLPPTRNDTRFHINNTSYGIKALDKWITKGNITLENAQLIRDYLTRRRVERDLSQGRVNKLTFTLLSWNRATGGTSFRAHTITDIYRGIEFLKTQNSQHGTPYSQNFISDAVATIKPFYLWMNDEGASSLKEKEIHSIKRPRRDLMTKTAADILTEDEIMRMISACQTSRDRAILMTLYDGGFRIGELGTLTWGQVKFDNLGCVINTDGKTGKPRYVRLTAAAPYLATWKQDYPFSPEKEALVFISNRKKALEYSAFYKQLQYIAERANIQKKVHPHIFRHTRITVLIRKKVPESAIKQMMWGSLTTDMFACYAHLTNENIDDAILEQAGVKRPDSGKVPKVLNPRQCPACYTINGPTHNFCGKCGAGLTEEARKILDVKTQAIEHNTRFEPDIEKLIARVVEQKIKEIQAS